MSYSVKNGQGSIVLRVVMKDSTVTTGAGKTGMSSATSGLIIGTIADNEASATAYTVAGSTVESIATLGTFAAPTATKCRFKEVDATNLPGEYELQIADARFAVSSAKYIDIMWSGATGLAQDGIRVFLRTIDPYDVRSLYTKQLTEGKAADGVAPTMEQFMFQIWSYLTERSYSGTTLTTKALDGSTTTMTFTLNASSGATAITRAT